VLMAKAGCTTRAANTTTYVGLTTSLMQQSSPGMGG